MPTTAAEFHTRVLQAGLPLTEADTAAVLPAWHKLEGWLALLRTPPIPATAESATTFRAEQAP